MLDQPNQHVPVSSWSQKHHSMIISLAVMSDLALASVVLFHNVDDDDDDDDGYNFE